MKKIFCCLLCLVFLCGCSKSQIEPCTQNICFSVQFEYGGEKYECFLETGSNGEFSASVVKPQKLEGLKYTYNNDELLLEYMGLQYKAAKNSVASGVIERIKNAFRDVPNHSAQKSGEEYIVNSNLGQESYVMHLSPSGLPISIDLSDVKILIFDVKCKN